MKLDMELNRIPAPTWNWLKMNAARVGAEIPPQAGIRPSVRNAGGERGISIQENGSAAERSLPPVRTGAGKNPDEIFGRAETEPLVITAAKNRGTAEPVILEYDLKDGRSGVFSQIIRAEENADITVIIVSSSGRKAAGFEALRTKLYAAKGARIHLVKVQLLGEGFVQIDDTGAVCAENAGVDITHVTLGGGGTYIGRAAALEGAESFFRSDTAYLCRGTQTLDINDIVTHTGKKTDSRMTVKGSLRDAAKKTYRGTIDFRKGCAGATGDEQEEALLLSPSAVNKSIPVILCGEEDVAGEHGASVGRLGEDVLFYMQSRGLSRAEAENTVARAKVRSVAAKIPDRETARKIERCMNGVAAYE